MTEFKTDFSKKDGYSVTFNTNDVGKYKFVQNACRQALDGVTERTCYNRTNVKGSFMCSVCDVYHFNIENINLINYCPTCGARVIN